MKLKSIELKERPREKLIAHGPGVLSNSELLAIMLDSGTKEESVLNLSSRLISEYGFSRLFKMTYSELEQIKGIKEAKACKLMALFEIARRVNKLDNKRTHINDDSDIFEYVKADYLFLSTEMLCVIYLDKKSNIIYEKKYKSTDSLKVEFPIKDIVGEAINNKAFALVLVHNHPSGDLTPSENDIMMTKCIKDVLDNLGIYLYDHLIINRNDYFSIMKMVRNK